MKRNNSRCTEPFENIDLLFESIGEIDRESVEYTESIFRLLKAYPETVMNCIANVKKEAKSDYCSTQNVKRESSVITSE
jgi:hypothetical protein